LRTRSPTRRSFHLLLYVVVVSLTALTGCGGPPSPTEEAPEEPSAGTAETIEEAGRLSMRDAVGQMFIVGLGGTEPDYYIEKMVRERNVGGVLLLGHDMRSEEQTKSLTDALQRLATSTDPAVPLLVAANHEGGEVQGAPWVLEQPAAAEVGERGDPGEARRIAEEIGRELLRGGVNTDLAPVVDTGSGAAIGSRSYGADPALVAQMGAASIKGFERAGVVSAAKHFPNHGPALADSHVALPTVNHDVETILNSDLHPFRAAVEAGAPIVMLGHLVYPALNPVMPASLSPAAVGLLRGELGFEGVIVTDDLMMEGAQRGGTTAEAAVEAAKAGVDLLMVSAPPEEQAAAYDAVVNAVESGEIPPERIEASVERIKNIKNRYLLYSGD